jgi:hypothetical protein
LNKTITAFQKLCFGLEAKVTFLFLGVMLSVSSVSGANPNTKEKVLVFPNEHSYGNLSKITATKPLELLVDKSPLGEARGTIKVPVNVRICYEPGPKFYQNPQILLKFSPDSIYYMKMPFIAMDDNEMQMSDRAVQFLTHLSGLRVVDFNKSDTTDAGAKKLAGMPNLTGMTAVGCLITGTCFRELSTCPKLEVIRLGSTQVSNESLRFLKNLKNLKRLDLNRAGLTSVGIQHIANFQSLLQLDISANPKITGKDLSKLTVLKKLELLNLRDTNLSLAEIKDFLNKRKVAVVMPRMLAQYSKAERDEIAKIKGDLRFDFGIRPVHPDINTIFGTVNRK